MTDLLSIISRLLPNPNSLFRPKSPNIKKTENSLYFFTGHLLKKCSVVTYSNLAVKNQSHQEEYMLFSLHVTISLIHYNNNQRFPLSLLSSLFCCHLIVMPRPTFLYVMININGKCSEHVVWFSPQLQFIRYNVS